MAPDPTGTRLCRIPQHMRFQLHHSSMDLVFNFDKGRFGVGFAPLFHIAQDLCAQTEPSFIIHDGFSLGSFFSQILPAFLCPGYPPLQKSASHPLPSAGSVSGGRRGGLPAARCQWSVSLKPCGPARIIDGRYAEFRIITREAQRHSLLNGLRPFLPEPETAEIRIRRGGKPVSEVRISENESFEAALKRFNRKIRA